MLETLRGVSISNQIGSDQNLRYKSSMKTHRSIFLGVALITSQLGGAQLPFPNQAFAKFEGTLDFCAKANPKDSGKYEKLKQELVKDATEKELLEVRATQEYKEAYLGAKNEFSKMPKEKAMKACSQSVGSGK